jgi:hypothetical protein
VKDAANSPLTAAIMGDTSHVLHHSEEGVTIDAIATLMLHGGATRIVQKFGRLYVLQMVRWLAFLMSDLSHLGAYQRRIEPLLGLNEPFVLFLNDDNYFLGRKTWSIYRP